MTVGKRQIQQDNVKDFFGQLLKPQLEAANPFQFIPGGVACLQRFKDQTGITGIVLNE